LPESSSSPVGELSIGPYARARFDAACGIRERTDGEVAVGDAYNRHRNAIVIPRERKAVRSLRRRFAAARAARSVDLRQDGPGFEQRGWRDLLG
jgi:hypothetical protein